MGVNNSACLACQPNEWCWTGVATHCPSHTVSPAYSSSIVDCLCVAGYSGAAGGACYGCGVGTFATGLGTLTCDGCLAGTYGTGQVCHGFATLSQKLRYSFLKSFATAFSKALLQLSQN